MNPLKKKPRTKNTSPMGEKPEWLRVKVKFPTEQDPVSSVRKNLTNTRLNTVCESASCPNLNNCWSRKTATYMLAGDICTRKCSYCDVASGKPLPLDKEEPIRIANSVRELGLRYVVITAVNRDDLKDGGAMHFHQTVQEIRKQSPECRIELLIPDLKGKRESLDLIYSANPDIINHNIETVKSLFKEVAPAKNYETSLSVLKDISEHGFITKSGIILGLGETLEEVKECIQDLRQNGVSMLTIGQYMQPTNTHYPVKEFIHPDIFTELKKFSYSLGYKHVESGALVRSSYHADEQADFLKSLKNA
ncbi:MAG TPA: lipoyl synthase [Leptospiraceae bacterium]|nr:lipoyl synthase [Leptospiraceae bacterium]HMW06056.1 lipoyl synthase [Leptospiraceae bacterium]HMX33926.1 lipoyl synthase [Leptospiraceae bacterium]HMY31402.1 lipoyl synthase [Leptospiraceae bacterium]HMZ64978.1 lipoyl synthase [Leptospiraceae bacterium]